MLDDFNYFFNIFDDLDPQTVMSVMIVVISYEIIFFCILPNQVNTPPDIQFILDKEPEDLLEIPVISDCIYCISSISDSNSCYELFDMLIPLFF